MDPKDRLETLVKTATSVTQKRMDLTPEQPHPAGIAVHYVLGVVPDALYGPLRHRVVGLAAGQGLLYGLGLFLVNDELLNPLLGLASGPTEYPGRRTPAVWSRTWGALLLQHVVQVRGAHVRHLGSERSACCQRHRTRWPEAGRGGDRRRCGDSPRGEASVG